MRLAWERYIRSTQKEGKDYLGISIYELDLENMLKKLSKKIISGHFGKLLRYPPKFCKPKPSGMQRTISILPIDDALFFQAIANLVACNGYKKLSRNNDFVLGYVLNEEVSLGNKLLRKKDANYFLFEGYHKNYKKFADSTSQEFRKAKVKFKLETDLTGFYDTIPHYNLLSVLADDFGVSSDILELLEGLLNVWSGTSDGPTPGVGIPQSCDSSHLFANIYLHYIDEKIMARGISYFRYMDDICIFGYKKSELVETLTDLDFRMKSRGLCLNSEKTKIEEIRIDQKKDEQNEFRHFIYHENRDIQSEDIEDLYSTSSHISSDVVDQSATGDYEIDRNDQELLYGSDFTNEDILKLAREDLEKIVSELPDLVQKIKEEVRKPEPDKRILNLALQIGHRFRVAQSVINNCTGGYELFKTKTRNHWLILASILFWRIDQFCWILNLYNDDKIVKKGLLKILENNQQYEWVRSEILSSLVQSQSFSIKELREQFFPMLKKEESWYAKRYIYKLILTNCRDKNLFNSILIAAEDEGYGPLRREILFFSTLWKDGDSRSKQLVDIFDK